MLSVCCMRWLDSTKLDFKGKTVPFVLQVETVVQARHCSALDTGTHTAYVRPGWCCAVWPVLGVCWMELE